MIALPNPMLRALAIQSCLCAALCAQQDGGPQARRLRAVRIEAGDVFSADQLEGNLLYRLANLLHATTREEVIAREIWLRPGDAVTRELADEVERNLRRLDLFGAAETELIEEGDRDADLVVRTRDRFSLAAGAGLTRVGGVTRLNVRAAETNLLGTGKQVVLVANRQGEEFTNYVRFTDPQLFGSWHELETKVGETEEGWFANFDIVRRPRHLADPLLFGVGYSGAQEDVDFYRFGDTAAEVPLRRHGLHLFAGEVTGPRELRTSLGAEVRVDAARYGAAFGPEAARIPVPGDTRAVELGPFLAIEYRPRFDRVQGLDALDYVEDLPLGADLRLAIAGSWRDETGAGADLRPRLDVFGRLSASPLAATYLTAAAAGDTRLAEDRLLDWHGKLALHAFQLSLPRQTLAASLSFELVGDREGLPRQLTLGEDNGLRGYPAREFAGTRFARLNVEDRIDTGLEVWSVRLGVAPFLDAGWVHDPFAGLSLGEPIRSVGAGLRFGSSHFLGGRVLRVDFAWPLDEVAGRDYGLSVSFALGQVFTFFGNASELGTPF
jgi:hypothetical protein